jgi:hypothetical protein
MPIAASIGAGVGALGTGGAILGAGALGAAGSIASSVIGSNAAESAANTQAQAAQNAENTQLQMFQTAQNAEAPYATVGNQAVNSLAGLYNFNGTNPGSPSPAALNAFTNSPDYAFALQQGTQAMQRSAAAGGTLISGGQLKAGQEFGQGLASQQYGNYYNRLLSLSQLGQSAAAGLSNAAVTSGANIGNTQQALGQSLASGTVGSANAITGGLNGATSSLSSAALLSAIAPKLGLGSNNGQSLSSYDGTSYGPMSLGGAPLGT